MREGYVVADGEAVGLVGLSVHHEYVAMLVPYDLKAHICQPAQNRMCRDEVVILS